MSQFLALKRKKILAPPIDHSKEALKTGVKMVRVSCVKRMGMYSRSHITTVRSLGKESVPQRKAIRLKERLSMDVRMVKVIFTAYQSLTFL